MEGPREVLGALFAFRGDMGEGGCAIWYSSGALHLYRDTVVN